MKISKSRYNIDPDEIFIDSRNLSSLDQQQFEGRIERALSRRSLLQLGIGFMLVTTIFVTRIGFLQVVRGEEFRLRSENNSLKVVNIPTERGVIYDRSGELLAWNDPGAGRAYTKRNGMAHVLGYLGKPDTLDLALGLVLDPDSRIGKNGVEKQYDDTLRGQVGMKYQEVDSKGGISSERISIQPKDGQQLKLSIDARVEEMLYNTIKSVADEREFTGGAGVIMDVNSGEVLAITSYPEFPLALLSGTTTDNSINDIFKDSRTPFVNRAISGLYAPGSIVKPIMAVAALAENIIDPYRQILSTGALEIPNPYNPGVVTTFKDWKAHGLVDMRQAIAVSSNVYFYEIGGGFQNQRGLGIANINEYTAMFGLGRLSQIDLPGELSGNVPSPEWKKDLFNGENWVLGDTYHTAIGQYGFQVTPLQMARAIGAIANNGKLLNPKIVQINTGNPVRYEVINVATSTFQVIREGMRLAVEVGTAKALDVPYTKIAAKTGTAELGTTKSKVNSWVEGFFPLDNPRYSFAIVMERGNVGNVIGAAAVARNLFDQMAVYMPEYLSYTSP
ncbi:MAG TPA: penicillin-binding transpeptidase domain-containing protein [Candidatus Paceibacterota bacterium]